MLGLLQSCNTGTVTTLALLSAHLDRRSSLRRGRPKLYEYFVHWRPSNHARGGRRMEGGASGGEGAAVGWLTVKPTRVTFYLLVIWFTRAKGIN